MNNIQEQLIAHNHAKPSEEARVALFRELLQTTFYVPARPNKDTQKLVFLAFPNENGSAVLPAFTSTVSLEKWSMQDEEYLEFTGSEIFEAVMQVGIQFVAIEPNSKAQLILSKPEIVNLAKGMVPVSEESVHRLDTDTEIRLEQIEYLPNEQFMEALLTWAKETKEVRELYFFAMNREGYEKSAVLGFLFNPGMSSSKMTEILNGAHQHCAHLIQPEEVFNILPITDPKMVETLRRIGAIIYSQSI